MENKNSSPNPTIFSLLNDEQNNLIDNSDPKTSRLTKSSNNPSELSTLSLVVKPPAKKIFCCPSTLTLIGVSSLVTGIIFEAKKVSLDIKESAQTEVNIGLITLGILSTLSGLFFLYFDCKKYQLQMKTFEERKNISYHSTRDEDYNNQDDTPLTYHCSIQSRPSD